MTAWVAEPPAAYASKPVAVVDCSVVAAAIFLEPAAREADALTRAYRLVAPSLLAYELANVAAQKLRRGETPAAILATQLSSLDAGVVELADVPPLGAFELARRYDLRPTTRATCGSPPSFGHRSSRSTAGSASRRRST